MRVNLYVSPVGLLAIGENELAVGRVFRGRPAERLRELQAGRPVPELEDFISDLKGRGVAEISCPDPMVAEAVRQVSDRIAVSMQGEQERKVRLDELAVRAGLVSSTSEYLSKLREAMITLTQESVKKAVARRDLMIVHAVKLLDDVEKQINTLYGRLMEWHGAHFPELREIIKDPYSYARFVYEVGGRSRVTHESVSAVLGVKEAGRVLEAAERSMGVDITEKDEDEMRRLARLIIEYTKTKGEIQEYIRSLMEIEAPNLSAIAGPTLGARLISLIGGLKELARAPASTIQVLGAERALFRFFKTGKGAPKHGVILQHPYLHSAPKWQRGKIARALATKISIAAKIDYFSSEDRSAELRKSLEDRIAEIKEKYTSPPVKAKPQRQKRRR